MKLHKVEIFGFKSFADKTVLEFHEGITCIVGPNGCGKSNIGDAIRWVLGEQSAKAMRGGKMPDVIFSGANTRKPLNFAEVTITFSDVDGALPTEYSEVAITRRLHRSGESEYFINRHLVRLKDVHSLFLDSGIGKNNFSIFEQGKIDQIIQYSPLERRYIFEEAAGISRFLERKRHTLKRLEEVGQNLSRVADIHQEVTKQIQVLQEQASFARDYKEKKERLLFLEKGLLMSRYDSYSKKHQDLMRSEADSKGRGSYFAEEKASWDLLFEKESAAKAEMEKTYQKLRDEFLAGQSAKELKAQGQRNDALRLSELLKKQEVAEREVAQLKVKQAGYTQEIAGFKADKERVQKALEEAKSEQKKAEQEFHLFEKELQKIRTNQVAFHHERVLGMKKKSALESELKQLVFRSDSHIEKKGHLVDRREQLDAIIRNKTLEVAEKKEIFLAKSAEVKEINLRFVEIEKDLKEVQGEISELEKELEKEVHEEHEVRARLKALLHLRKEFEGFSAGGKKLLQAAADEKSPLFGIVKALYESIVPKEGYESAVSAVLKRYAETLAVQSRHDFFEVLSFAKAHQIADFSLVCLEFLKASPKKEGSLLEHVSENALSQHFLNGVLLEEELEEALMKGRAIWSSSHGFVDANGVLFIQGASDQSVFLRESEIKSLEIKITALVERKTALKGSLDARIKKRMELQQLRSETDQAARRAEMKSVEANFTMQKSQGELDHTKKEGSHVLQEIEALSLQITSLLAQKEKAEISFKEAIDALDEIEKKSHQIESHLQDKSRAWEEKKTLLKESEQKLSFQSSEFHKLTYSLNLLGVKEQETKSLLERLLGEIKSYQETLSEIEKRSTSALLDLSSLDQDLGKKGEEVKALEKKLQEMKTHLTELQAKGKTLDSGLKEVEGKIHHVGIQLAHVETGRASIALELKERFEVDAEGLLGDFQKIPEGAEKEIKSLKAFLDANQNVNLAAIDDCVAQEARAEFLGNQMGDLSGSKDELLKMIGELDTESRTLFKQTFEAIRSHFQKNFEVLFKGGEADLELLESPDILEAGIEITAKPPGKQMRSLSLLSGGEKCLTAMALLFAIFEVKSSPFCILDEIDAPLDDSNVERFLNMVKQFIDRCQFIIVTHNKRTMALGDRLYGVSMQEKGVSKLLSMEFSKEKKQVPVPV